MEICLKNIQNFSVNINEAQLPPSVQASGNKITYSLKRLYSLQSAFTCCILSNLYNSFVKEVEFASLYGYVAERSQF